MDRNDFGSAAIEAKLAEALANGPLDLQEPSAYFNSAAVRAEATHLPPDQARALCLREVDRCARWLRAIEFGTAGTDAVDRRSLEDGLRDHLLYVATMAAQRGMLTGEPPEQLAAEAAQVAAFFEPNDSARGLVAQVLAYCYGDLARPELALSVVVRAPVSAGAGEHLLRVLDLARRAVALGHREHVAALLALEDWPGDPTGLHKELLSRLVNETTPSEQELAARGDVRRAAFGAGDFAALRELALFDVMWLETDANLWLALSAILKVYGATEQAELARQAAAELGGDGGVS
ncbi:hypothetical protein [Kribbella yunnanensis]|uniref:hypothetical protein n=1 Tax=Kribbella yunnanensis TaxID=190194 RepID=UPI0031DDE248